MAKPKILTLDIETAPGVAYFWSRFDKYNIPLERVKKPTRIICWSAKWLGKKEMLYADEYGKKGPKGMFAKVHKLLSKADAVVTFNGDRFDLQRLNGAFVEHSLGPIPPVASIDLFKTVRKLGLVSSSLQFIAWLLKIGQKVKHAGFPLWVGWDEKEPKSRKKMKKYNAQDVRLTEKVYKALRPYIKNHPYLGNPEKVRGKLECQHCGKVGGPYQYRGYYRTRTTFARRWQCLVEGCFGWNTGPRQTVKKNAKSK